MNCYESALVFSPEKNIYVTMTLWHGSAFCITSHIYITGLFWSEPPATSGWLDKGPALMFHVLLTRTTCDQTVESPVIRDAITVIWCRCNVLSVTISTVFRISWCKRGRKVISSSRLLLVGGTTLLFIKIYSVDGAGWLGSGLGETAVDMGNSIYAT